MLPICSGLKKFKVMTENGSSMLIRKFGIELCSSETLVYDQKATYSTNTSL
jgi:hypothetical protein